MSIMKECRVLIRSLKLGSGRLWGDSAFRSAIHKNKWKSNIRGSRMLCRRGRVFLRLRGNLRLNSLNFHPNISSKLVKLPMRAINRVEDLIRTKEIGARNRVWTQGLAFGLRLISTQKSTWATIIKISFRLIVLRLSKMHYRIQLLQAPILNNGKCWESNLSLR